MRTPGIPSGLPPRPRRFLVPPDRSPRAEVARPSRSRVGYPGNALIPWTTIAVRFHDLGTAIAAEVVIAFEDCDPDVDCEPQLLGSTGELERRILDRIRARLESPEKNPLAEL